MSNAETHRAMHDAFNASDFDAIVARTTTDFTYTDHPRDTTVKGGGEFVAYLKEWKTAMSDAACTQGRYVDAGDTSVALFLGSGTNDGPLGPLPATGKALRFPICEVLTYDASGNCTGGEIYYDQVTMLTQLGHLAPGS